MAEDPLAALDHEERQALAQLAQAQADGSMTRREWLKLGAALGVGGLVGGGGAAALTGSAAAANDSGASVGTTGASADVVLDQLKDPGGDQVLDVDDTGAIAGQNGRTWDFPAVQTVESTTKENPHVDVTHPDYGAVGDGTTDDNAALQAAINDAESKRRDVFLPPGTYYSNGDLTVDTAVPNATIKTGGEATILFEDGFGFDFNAAGWELDGLKVEGTDQTSSATSVLVDATGGGVSITGGRIRYGDTGVLVDNASQLKFESVFFDNLSRALEFSSASGTPVNHLVRDCTFGSHYGDKSVVYSEGYRVSVSDCLFETVADALSIEVAGAARHNRISDNDIYNSGGVKNDGNRPAVFDNNFKNVTGHTSTVIDVSGVRGGIGGNVIQESTQRTGSIGINLAGDRLATGLNELDNVETGIHLQASRECPVGLNSFVLCATGIDYANVPTDPVVSGNAFEAVTTPHNAPTSGTRTLINGQGYNSGDPSSTGAWNGEGREGVVVYDTSVSRPYTEYQYVNGAWQAA